MENYERSKDGVSNVGVFCRKKPCVLENIIA